MKRLFPLILILLLSSCQRKAVEEFVSYVKAADELFSSGQDEEAMIALTSAEDAYTEDVPLVELGSVKMRKGDIYYRFSNFKDAVNAYTEGTDIFLSAGDTLNYTRGMLLVCDASILDLDAARAHMCIGVLQNNLRYLEGQTLHAYHLCRIKLADLEGGPKAAVPLADKYLEEMPDEEKVSWRIISYYYNAAGEYDKALDAIRKEARYRDVTRDQNYYVVLYQVLKSQNDYHAALEALERHNTLADSLARIYNSSDARFVEERHQLNKMLIRDRRIRGTIIWLSVIVLAVFALALWETRKRMIASMEDKVRMQIENEKLECLYKEARTEQETLNKMAAAAPDDNEMKNVIKQRLALLNKVIASYITDSSEANKEANELLEMLISDRESFLESTRKSFEAGHPRFMKYLRSCGLTDWETNYCCLYLVGLNGKEIGEYINLKRHYTYGSVIRQKLGLGEHDRNLAGYLKELLENPPA